MSLPGDQRLVLRQLAREVSSQDPGLQLDGPPVTDLIAEQRVTDLCSQPPFPRPDNRLAPLGGQRDGNGPDNEVRAAQFPVPTIVSTVESASSGRNSPARSSARADRPNRGRWDSPMQGSNPTARQAASSSRHRTVTPVQPPSQTVVGGVATDLPELVPARMLPQWSPPLVGGMAARECSACELPCWAVRAVAVKPFRRYLC
jgi:hypothetical protein